MIPKILHRIWLGNNSLPDAYRVNGERFLELNPDWELRLWTEANLPASLVNQREFNYETELSGRSNILRLEILAAEGGVYFDCDVEPLKPMPELPAEAFVVPLTNLPDQLCNAIMGAAPGAPLLQTALRCLPGHNLAYGAAPPHLRNGSHLLTNLCRYAHTETPRLDAKQWYPAAVEDVQAARRAGVSIRTWLTDAELSNAIALHHWDGH